MQHLLTDERFQRARLRVLTDTEEHAGIGMLSEKTLHRMLKFTVAPDESCHEVKVLGRVADVLTDGGIVEIQTRSLHRLRPKLETFLPAYKTTVLYPLPHEKQLRWIDPKTGEISPARRSPKICTPIDAVCELYSLSDLLLHEGLTVYLVFLDVEEYRYLDGWSYDNKKGSNRCERVPAALLGTLDLRSAEDYRPFLSPELPDEFTASEFGKLYGFRGKAVYSALKVFLAIGLFEKIGTRGRSALYCRTDAKQETETACATLSEIEQEDLCE